MITEDYVSFEIAKLLKEKGFCNIATMLYKENGDIVSYNVPLNNKGFSSTLGVFYEAPTIQTAMKWLRNQHNLHIMVDCIGSKNYMPTIQFICNSKDIKVESDENKIGGRGFDSFEEACEAAIKYCLENLI